jgi:D-arabinose 1-dehydrogenase-like Zn-dependent alcohol dehydrogenase
MDTRLFYTDGIGNIHHTTWDKPEPSNNQIEVKSVYTGLCRSDLDMHSGLFQLLPKTIQGHESIGIVTKVGKDISPLTAKEGDFVATRGEPAFADYYNCNNREFVTIPKLSPKYIVEPVACGINVAKNLAVTTASDILILGSGFLSTVVHTMLTRHYGNQIVVVGAANKDYWQKQGNVIMQTAEEIKNRGFDYVVDLSDKPEYLNWNVYNNCAKIVLAAEKHPFAKTSFAEMLWKAVEVKFPSPRNDTFYDSMILARDLISEGVLNTETLWTHSYARESEVEAGFSEGLNRPAGYSRGYIEWKV